ncbi:lysophospholipid acyltransferase family protein [Luteolibacter flavescens]|uniref:Lysophospholipid acyltransferase family protein n=1 Tax=Luteolibacter flavescens TaxID=1859460 RepID=A0ABT3FJZ7_9BACT|nr:lysophospholipid acyltransferase family protein [Luteolibacter flavescens]MCW1883611.1 lysophospholipid acyltransferase family protein [Luteolibacter flavescens]
MSEAADETPKSPTLAHRLEYAAFRAAEGLLSLFSLETTVRVGQGLGVLAWALFPKWRKLVERNLRIATAADETPPDAAEIGRMVRETFRRAGNNLLSSQRAALMTPEELQAHIEFEGLEHLLEPVKAGRGVVLVWSHMGNWEVLAQLVKTLGPDAKGGPIFRRLENPLLDELTVQRRTQQGAVLFDKHDGFNGPAALLREGGVVTVMTDQRAGGHGELCPFFGRLSSCTPLPALLARRTGAAMVTLSVFCVGTGRWRLKVRPVPDKARTPEVLTHLETAMRDRLTDVFWFHDRWRIDRVRPLCFFTKQVPTEAARTATVPTRLAVTLPAGRPDAVEVLHELLELRPDLRIDVLDSGDLPALPDDPRIVRFPWDREGPEIHAGAVVEQCGASHPAPLDFVLLLGGELPLALEAKRLGLRAIIGVAVSGKPWTKSFPMPADAEGWRNLAGDLVLTAKNRKA